MKDKVFRISCYVVVNLLVKTYKRRISALRIDFFRLRTEMYAPLQKSIRA